MSYAIVNETNEIVAVLQEFQVVSEIVASDGQNKFVARRSLMPIEEKSTILFLNKLHNVYGRRIRHIEYRVNGSIPSPKIIVKIGGEGAILVGINFIDMRWTIFNEEAVREVEYKY